jgi:hypothetical protein
MRENIGEKTAAEMMAINPSKAFKPARATTPAIPETYSGKYVNIMAVATDSAMTEEQMDLLEIAVEEITGIHKAFCLIGPARIPTDRVLDGYELRIKCRAKFTITNGSEGPFAPIKIIKEVGDSEE